MADLNKLSFVDYDFDSLVQELTTKLQNKSEVWKDTFRSGTGQMLIELFAYIANLVLFYVERRAEEGYIQTASIRSSVINLVKLLNFTPKRATSSGGSLVFSITSAHTKNIFIPKWTEAQNSSGLKFVTSVDGVILTGQTSVSVPAIQGFRKEIEVISSGKADQEVLISSIKVENNTTKVFINDVEWTKVSSFFESLPESEHYKLQVELDETINIIFSNGKQGKIPPLNSTIKVQYVETEGVKGNIFSPNIITTLNSQLFDSDAVVQTVTVTNSVNFLGGDDPEDIEEIREEAPKVFKTGDRGVTKADIIAILFTFAGVADATAWGENEESPPNFNLFNTVRIITILQNWALPDANFKIILADQLRALALITVKYEFIDPVIIDVVPTLDIKINPAFSLATVQSSVETTLTNEFILGSTTKLGVSKRISDVVAAVDNTDGVNFHHLVLEIRRVLTPAFDSFFDFGQMLEAIPIKPKSIKVFINDVLEAIDDGVGGFIDQSSAFAITGSINYTTGVIGLDISPSTMDTVFVRYQQDNKGDIIVSKRQILKLFKTDVTSIT